MVINWQITLEESVEQFGGNCHVSASKGEKVCDCCEILCSVLCIRILSSQRGLCPSKDYCRILEWSKKGRSKYRIWGY